MTMAARIKEAGAKRPHKVSSPHRLTECRARVIGAAEIALKERERDVLDEEIA